MNNAHELNDNDIADLAVVLDALGKFDVEDGEPTPSDSFASFLRFGAVRADGNKEEGGMSPSRLRE